MRRIEDFETETAATIVSWLDENGDETDDEDAIEDYVVELDSGECCLMASALFETMKEAGFVEEARAN